MLYSNSTRPANAVCTALSNVGSASRRTLVDTTYDTTIPHGNKDSARNRQHALAAQPKDMTEATQFSILALHICLPIYTGLFCGMVDLRLD